MYSEKGEEGTRVTAAAGGRGSDVGRRAKHDSSRAYHLFELFFTRTVYETKETSPKHWLTGLGLEVRVSYIRTQVCQPYLGQ